jgi:hypothetical protein
MKTISAKMQVDHPVTEGALDEAIESGEARRRAGLNATTVIFLDPCLAVGFEDGSGVLLPVKNYPEFDGFETEDFAGLKVGFAGAALFHEDKDLQVSIAGLISSRNGRQSSAAKAEAARANGKKGGRPRKVDAAL